MPKVLKTFNNYSKTFEILTSYVSKSDLNLKRFKIMHYDLYRLKNEKEIITLGIFQENENAIKIIEWPSLIKIPISDKLEIHLDYAKHDNERKLRLSGTGKWKNFE